MKKENVHDKVLTTGKTVGEKAMSMSTDVPVMEIGEAI